MVPISHISPPQSPLQAVRERKNHRPARHRRESNHVINHMNHPFQPLRNFKFGTFIHGFNLPRPVNLSTFSSIFTCNWEHVSATPTAEGWEFAAIRADYK